MGRQAALTLYEKLDRELKKSGFRKSAWAAGFYFLAQVVLLVWVDHVLLVGEREIVEATRKILQEAFMIRDMGPVFTFLGYES